MCDPKQLPLIEALLYSLFITALIASAGLAALLIAHALFLLGLLES